MSGKGVGCVYCIILFHNMSTHHNIPRNSSSRRLWDDGGVCTIDLPIYHASINQPSHITTTHNQPSIPSLLFSSLLHSMLFCCTVFTLSLIHISEPTRLLSISYAVFCLKKKKKKKTYMRSTTTNT
eukprot:TRINITY_DN50968_c0_g1_i1.p1 TRINITY_DN50968_c0_g1~~TRINITY_DN50968_c0_g1_i1.p1  ORF type:complete len:126 (+),score=28.92 TRINITY_DN50968_c0_g1_i1:434-811(+)